MNYRYFQKIETKEPAEFIDGSNMHFLVKSIPLPAEVTRTIKEKFNYKTDSMELVEEHRMALACPHCLKNIDFVFPSPRMETSFAEELMEAANNGDPRYRERVRQMEALLAAAAALNLASSYNPLNDL